MDLTISFPFGILMVRFAGLAAKRRFLHGEEENSREEKRGRQPVRARPAAANRPDRRLILNRAKRHTALPSRWRCRDWVRSKQGTVSLSNVTGDNDG